MLPTARIGGGAWLAEAGGGGGDAACIATIQPARNMAGMRMPVIITAPVSLLPFCRWLAETRGSIALHESELMYPLVESLHVLTLCVFVGMSVLLDLRLLGLTMRRVPVREI